MKRPHTIPAAALELAGFSPGEKVSYHVAERVIVTLKGRMTALEMLHAVHALHRLSEKLLEALRQHCGSCDACSGPDAGESPCLDAEDLSPQEAKTAAAADPERQGLWLSALPEEVLSILEAQDIRLCVLERCLAEGGVIYGRE